MTRTRRHIVSAGQRNQTVEEYPAGALTRRQALRLALLSGLGGLVAACSSTTASPTPQAQLPRPPATQAAAVANGGSSAPSAVAAPTAAPQASAVAAPTAQPAALASAMAQAATQYLGSLDDAGRSKTSYAFGDSERQRWHWTTPRGFPRNGLPLNEMNQDQRALALALLRTSVSEAGYQKALDIMSLQRDLGNDPELYYVTVFGTPGGAEPWGWRFEGHHLSRNFTVVGQQIAQTPFFLGSWPTVASGGLRAMAREEDAARELVRSLEGPSREVAIFQARTLTNHVTQNQPWVTPLDPVGISAGDLSADQQALVLEIIQTYLGVQPPNIATPMFEGIRSAGIENSRFGWAGSVEPRRPHYYRLQGPTFLLEFDNSRNGGTHIHSVWRDFTGDFGQNLL
jgi:uncharacterized protein DUF3500